MTKKHKRQFEREVRSCINSLDFTVDVYELKLQIQALIIAKGMGQWWDGYDSRANEDIKQ